jgi:DNA topoisomerase-1
VLGRKRVWATVGGGYLRLVARGGWRRRGRKRFRYLDAAGAEIRDEEALERIESLAIPPAWRDVWISPSPRARVQATGVDRAGRKQYLYHPSFRAARERAKFEQLLDFAKSLPALRATTARHLRGDDLERDWTCALAVSVVDRAWFRVGSPRHTRRSRTHGVTTLTKRHASVQGDEVQFCFRTKNRRLVRRSVRNRSIARGVSLLLDLPGGGRLFRYEREGDLVALSAATLNDYIAAHMGEAFTAKDFRTWGGTLLAASELARRGPADDERGAKRVIAAAMSAVGEELGNTPAVARSSYVSPLVLDAFLEGRTLDHFRPASGRGSGRLTADERALVRLLRATSR